MAIIRSEYRGAHELMSCAGRSPSSLPAYSTIQYHVRCHAHVPRHHQWWRFSWHPLRLSGSPRARWQMGCQENCDMMSRMGWGLDGQREYQENCDIMSRWGRDQTGLETMHMLLCSTTKHDQLITSGPPIWVGEKHLVSFS